LEHHHHTAIQLQNAVERFKNDHNAITTTGRENFWNWIRCHTYWNQDISIVFIYWQPTWLHEFRN